MQTQAGITRLSSKVNNIGMFFILKLQMLLYKQQGIVICVQHCKSGTLEDVQVTVMHDIIVCGFVAVLQVGVATIGFGGGLGTEMDATDTRHHIVLTAFFEEFSVQDALLVIQERVRIKIINSAEQVLPDQHTGP